MSWSGLAANQWVSYNNLQDAIDNGYLPPNTTGITASDRWIRKDQVSTYVINDTSNGYYTSKSSSQWLAKQDITSGISTSYYYSLYYTVWTHGAFEGWTTGADACAYSGAYNITLYSTDSVLSVGTIFYSSTIGAGFSFANPSGSYFYVPSIDSYVTLTWAGNGYPFVIASIDACAVTYYYYDADQYMYCFYNGSGYVIRSTTSLTLDWVCGTDGHEYYLTGINAGSYYDTDATGPVWGLCTSLSC